MTPLAWVIVLFLTAQTAVMIWNLWYWVGRRFIISDPAATVSVLIPARNELHALPRLLAALQAQTYRPVEIIVCDDGSDDGLTEWLEGHAGEYGVTWFRAPAKPEGWVGKTWACHQLGQRAQGDWLLFLDADIVPYPGFVRLLAGLMTDTPAQMVTAFPRLRPSDLVDGLLECMVGFVVFTLIPLQLSERPRYLHSAFANGQVIGFRRPEYRRLWPHQEVRGCIVDDVELARQVKRRGGSVLLVEATAEFEVRMYRNGWEAIDGFAKNTVSAVGGLGPGVAQVPLVALWWLAPLAFAIKGQLWAMGACGLTALLFGMSATLACLPWWYGLCYPLAMLLAEFVLIRSILWHLRGQVRWKGRTYRL